MKNKVKLIICGAVVLVVGVLMFGDKIAPMTNLPSDNFLVKVLVDNPLILIRDSKANSDKAKKSEEEAKIANENADKAREYGNEQKAIADKVKGSASNYDYFTVEVVNMPVAAGINNIAIISASYFTNIPSSKEVVFKSGVDWTNKLGVTTKSLGKRVKELPQLDYNNYAKNEWKKIGK